MRDRVAEPKITRKSKAKPAAPAEPQGGLGELLDLQRTAGNAAVLSMLSGQTEAPVQAKLQVGAVNDPAEAEADRIADAVMRNLATDEITRRQDDAIHRTPDGQIYQAVMAENEHEEEEAEQQSGEASSIPNAPANAPSAQYLAGETDSYEGMEEEGEESAIPEAPGNAPSAAYLAGEEDEYEGMPSETEEPQQQQQGQQQQQQQQQAQRSATVQRKEDASGSPGHGYEGGAVDPGVAKQIDSSRGGGKPLEGPLRSKMESGFGADFSNIRIHEGSKAAELNRSLNAKAFTTGSDIFLGSGGVSDKILAHELAHTVQQGAATAQRTPVRRFMAIDAFEKLTYESWDSTKSTAQKEIIKMLTAYTLLCGPPKKKGDKPAPPPEKLQGAIDLVKNMQSAAQAYVAAKSGAKDKKAKRLAGFVSFEASCTAELTSLNTLKAAADKAGTAQTAVSVDSKGLEKLQQHYKGTLSGSMEKAGLAVEQLAGENGASGEFTLDVDVPVSPGVTVGAHFKFEAKRGGKPEDKKPGAVEVGCELGFKVGGDALFAKIQAGIGGYFKASGRDANAAMKLVSYGLYRRCRESSVIPSEIANKLWGGDSGEKGKKKAEQWSLDVEKEEFGDNEAWVETGAYASVGVKGGVEGVAEAEGEVKGSTGKKYDKESLTNSAKGGVGADNTKGDNWFAQKTTGRNVTALELSAKAALIDAFGAELKLNFQWEASGKKGEASKLRGIEIKVAGHGSLPSGAFSEKLSSVVVDFVAKVKQLQKGQLQKASTLSQVGAGVTTAWGIADTTVTGLEGAPTVDIVKDALKLGAKEGAKTGGKEGAKSLVDSASKVGLELAYTFKYEDGACWSQFEILHRKALDAKIPGLLSAELIRRKRLLVASNQGGSWKWELMG